MDGARRLVEALDAWLSLAGLLGPGQPKTRHLNIIGQLTNNAAMPRPSTQQDEALIRAGRRLYPSLGCSGLTLRRLAEEAGVKLSMVHYHFGGKDAFLGALLQQMYDEMYDGLVAPVPQDRTRSEQLAAALAVLARFVRDHRSFVGRVWADASSGEQVAQAFLQRNAPRHLAVLMPLIEGAPHPGDRTSESLLARAVYLMGSVVAPILVAGGAKSLGVLPKNIELSLEADVLSDAAIDKRIGWALAGLREGVR